MAAKIKEGLKDITQGVVERLKGGPKYADNLLGESLQDQLRRATAKELNDPSEELNAQVVDTINQDVSNGKDSKEIAWLLRRRLRTDNPHKQWLAVLLVGRVMRDCNANLRQHRDELLEEVARVLQHPARPESGTGKVTRQAAKDLLRSYGRAGTSAFRAVNRSTLSSASLEPVYDNGSMAAAREAAKVEVVSVLAEVQLLIDQAKANTELLSEMLVADNPAATTTAGGPAPSSSAPGSSTAAAPGPTGGAQVGTGAAADEFESELTRELLMEVRELRSLFDVYLEQLQAMSGPEVEALMLAALEAADMLDGTLALQQDVLSNQRELEQQASGGAAGPSALTAGGGSGPAAPADRDLISLDDSSEVLPQPRHMGPGGAPAAVATPQDPFAGLDSSALQSQFHPQQQQQQQAYAAMQQAAYPGLYGTAVPGPQQPLHPQQQTQHALTSFGFGHPQPQQQHTAVAIPTATYQQQSPTPYANYGMPATVSPYSTSPPAVAAVAAPPQHNPNNPFATATAAVPIMPYSAAAAAAAPLATTPSGNPFAAAGGPAATGIFGSPPAAAVPAPAAVPFAGAPAATQTVDTEWALFFADRAGGAATGTGAAAAAQRPTEVLL